MKNVYNQNNSIMSKDDFLRYDDLTPEQFTKMETAYSVAVKEFETKNDFEKMFCDLFFSIKQALAIEDTLGFTELNVQVAIGEDDENCHKFDVHYNFDTEITVNCGLLSVKNCKFCYTDFASISNIPFSFESVMKVIKFLMGLEVVEHRI